MFLFSFFQNLFPVCQFIIILCAKQSRGAFIPYVILVVSNNSDLYLL